ncbi:hypothetical protein BFP97_17855 [Roseivirga sp. 4D4]|nr:hypothetical protein BFP97_17855 [Roseivirga sp. 4D4]
MTEKEKLDSRIQKLYGVSLDEFNGYFISYVTRDSLVHEVCINCLTLGHDDKSIANIQNHRFTISGHFKDQYQFEISEYRKDGMALVQRDTLNKPLTRAQKKGKKRHIMTFGRNWRRTLACFISGKNTRGENFTHHADKIIQEEIIEEITGDDSTFEHVQRLVIDYINDLNSHKDLTF